MKLYKIIVPICILASEMYANATSKLAKEKFITEKERCILQSEHRDADQDQLKMLLKVLY